MTYVIAGAARTPRSKLAEDRRGGEQSNAFRRGTVCARSKHHITMHSVLQLSRVPHATIHTRDHEGRNAQCCTFQERARQRQPAQSLTLKRWSHLPLFSRVRCPSSSALLFTFRVASTRIVLALPAAARRHRMIFPAMICESLLTGALLSAAVRTFAWPLFGRGGMNSAGTGTSSPSS